jgi:hypothetical protein
MKTMKVLDAAANEYLSSALRFSGGTFLLFLLRAAVVGGMAVLGFRVVIPAIERASGNALLSGIWLIFGLVVLLVFTALIFPFISRAYVLGGIKKIGGVLIIAAVQIIFIGAVASAFLLFMLSNEYSLEIALLRLVYQGLSANIIISAVLAGLSIVVFCVLFSFVLPIYINESKLISAFLLSCKLVIKSVRKAPLLWLARFVWAVLIAAMFVFLVALAGVFIKAPIAAANQYLYDALYLICRAAIALCLLSVFTPVSAILLKHIYLNTEAMK